MELTMESNGLGRFIESMLPTGVSPLSFGVGGAFAKAITGKSIEGFAQSVAPSLLNDITKAGLTGQQIEQNEWTAQREDTQYQRLVADLEKAGINPAMVFGKSAQPVSSPSASNNGASVLGSFSNLLELATLPLQLKSLRADIENTEANTEYLEQKRKTEEQVTKLKSIMVEWQPTINAESVAKLSAEVDKAQSTISLQKAQMDYASSQNEAQRITNSVLSEKLRSEINSNDARARQAAASAALLKVQADYANQHQCLMSSNDFVVLASYIGYLFGTSPEKIVSQVTDYINSGELKSDLSPWKNVSGEEAMDWFVSHASSASAD